MSGHAQTIHHHDPTERSLASHSRTLLPGPIASLVTTFAQTASFGLRVGTKVGGFAIAGARETTLTSLELTRAAVEAIFTRAGRDLSERRSDELGRVEAESILERSISSLHYTISSISFFASSSFYLSSAVLTSASTLSVQGLSTLNAVLGSTESSRAVAAIIELIKDEFKKPESGKEGEFVGYLDLFSGTVGFVLLQRWGRHQTEQEFRRNGGEQVIWDAVIDDKGFRADVIGTTRTKYFDGRRPVSDDVLRRGRPVSFLSPAGDEAIEAIERGTVHEIPQVSLFPEDRYRLSDTEIRQHILNQLPDGCHAVIASETITAKTIRVDLYNSGATDITPPPGTVMVREHFHHAQSNKPTMEQTIPSQTIVFRTALRRTGSAEMESAGTPALSFTTHGHPDTPYDSDDGVILGHDTGTEYLNQPTESPESSQELVSLPHQLSYENGKEAEQESPRSDIACRPPIANQKRARRPIVSTGFSVDTGKLIGTKLAKASSSSKPGSGSGSGSYGSLNKAGPLRKAFKSLSSSPPTTRMKANNLSPIAHESAGQRRDSTNTTSRSSHHPPMPRLPTQAHQNKSLPRLPPEPNGLNTSGTSPSLAEQSTSPISPSYFTVRGERHDTLVREIETYTSRSFGSRNGSPTIGRTHSRTMSGLSKTKSDRDMTVSNSIESLTGHQGAHHRRSKSLMSSFCSMASNGSEGPLILATKGGMPTSSIFDDHQVLSALATEGKVPGIFPDDHLVRNIRRYVRFSSASYGSQFLRFMGLTATVASGAMGAEELKKAEVHHEHSSFSNHTGLPPETILLSSFEDPHGGVGFSQSPSSALPLVHFVSIDRESKAVVLTCRGTLGFEDVLTDMLCDFDDLFWRGKSYKVHKGIHASARRMLGGSGSRVMATLKAALEEYADFGLVLTGHSLGGAVASLVAILISEPSAVEESGSLFATTSPQKMIAHPDLAHKPGNPYFPHITLPAGRPVHVYAYGPPATLSPDLRVATRGLITTVVNSNDIVPTLSLGILHDFRTVALNLKHDTTGAIAALKSRVWARVRHAAQSTFYVDGAGSLPPVENTAGDGLGEDSWAWNALKTLREGMASDKLVPPGEVFVVETTRVFDRQDGGGSAVHSGAGMAVAGDSATERVFRSLGRPTTRVQMKLIRDVEARFGELRFGSRMFSDHSPARYEATLAALETGILEG